MEFPVDFKAGVMNGSPWGHHFDLFTPLIKSNGLAEYPFWLWICARSAFGMYGGCGGGGRAAPLYTNGFFEERAEVIVVIHNEDCIFRVICIHGGSWKSAQAWAPLASAYFIISNSLNS